MNRHTTSVDRVRLEELSEEDIEVLRAMCDHCARRGERIDRLVGIALVASFFAALIVLALEHAGIR